MVVGGNISDAADVDAFVHAAVNRFGTVDGVASLADAAFASDALIGTVPIEVGDGLSDVNLTGPFLVVAP